jgi:hypothetical protein
MIKTHNKTGLKYLCKTSTDDPNKPFKYFGSGKHWKRHLKKHGYLITTQILCICETREELIEKGIFYSRLYNVVKSKKYANMIEERGDGGPTMLGRKITTAQNKRKSIALQKFHANKTEKYNVIRNQINSLSHALVDNIIYITPAGEFLTCTEASILNKLSSSSIKKHCLRGYKNDIIDSRCMGRALYMKKTWKDIGYDLRRLTSDEIKKYKADLDVLKHRLKSHAEGAIPDYKL